ACAPAPGALRIAGRIPPATSGTVLSVESSAGTFSVLTPKGADVTVDVTSATKYMERGATSPTLADVSAGEVVVVGGTTSSGTVTATSVGILGHEGAPPGPAGSTAPAATGAVLSVDTAGNSFNILTPKGSTETVDVTSATTYEEPGGSSAALANLSRGERVSVMGTSSTGGTVSATSVFVEPDGLGGPRHGPGMGRPGPGGDLRGGPGWGEPPAGQVPAGQASAGQAPAGSSGSGAAATTTTTAAAAAA
ncbi:MAG TPA: DUF5666 domain-containing protein, partial [Acidimicrobiales bacterium]|nr:DUF5666 domain-containing protein [Acidimicrobiales bacterium]